MFTLLRRLIQWLFGTPPRTTPEKAHHIPKPAVAPPPANVELPTPPAPALTTAPGASYTPLPNTTPLGQGELTLPSTEPPEYRKCDSLMTYRERVFYRALQGAVGDDFVIFSKVRLGDVVWLVNEPGNRKYHNNQIQCKHLDFVLCELTRLMPMLAIELDDSSHTRYDRRVSDDVKNMVCATAKLPLLRVVAQRHYDVQELRERVNEKTRANSICTA